MVRVVGSLLCDAFGRRIPVATEDFGRAEREKGRSAGRNRVFRGQIARKADAAAPRRRARGSVLCRGHLLRSALTSAAPSPSPPPPSSLSLSPPPAPPLPPDPASDLFGIRFLFVWRTGVPLTGGRGDGTVFGKNGEEADREDRAKADRENGAEAHGGHGTTARPRHAAGITEGGAARLPEARRGVAGGGDRSGYGAMAGRRPVRSDGSFRRTHWTYPPVMAPWRSTMSRRRASRIGSMPAGRIETARSAIAADDGIRDRPSLSACDPARPTRARP